MLNLPSRLAALLAALPDFAIAGLALATWINPQWLGEDKVQWFLGLMLLEFIVIHSSAFLGVVALSDKPRSKRFLAALGLSAFYTLLAAGFSLGLESWWPLAAFWALTANRLLGILIGQAPDGEETALMAAGWGAGAVFYVLGAVATVVPPIPRFGIRPEMVGDLAADSGGLWVDQPHRVVAFAVLYFTCAGLFNLFAHRWLKADEGRLSASILHPPT